MASYIGLIATATSPVVALHRPGASQIPAFLTSGTFWAAAAAVIGAVAIIVSCILWRLGSPPKLLTYCTVATTPLLGNWPGLQIARLQVQMDGKPLINPYLTILRVQNRSRRDIASRDFDDDLPLRFDLGARFRFATDAGSTIEYQPTLSATETGIALGPLLIGGGQSIQLAIITDGRPRITCRSPLIGVKVKEQGTSRLLDPELRWTIVWLVLGSTLIATSGIALLGIPLSCDVAVSAVTLVIGLLALAVAVYRVHRLVLRPSSRPKLKAGSARLASHGNYLGRSKSPERTPRRKQFHSSRANVRTGRPGAVSLLCRTPTSLPDN